MEKSYLCVFLGLVDIKDHMLMLVAAYFHSFVLTACGKLRFRYKTQGYLLI